jgi:tetratricopeptide (TPR) repeat protein
VTEADIRTALQQAVSHLNRDAFDAAEQVLDAVRAARPALPQALMLMGVLRLAQSRPADAEALLSNALAQSPGQPAVLLHLGHALRAQGRVEEALARYRQVMAQAPGHSEAALALATLLLEQEDYPAAETAARSGLPAPDPFLAAELHTVLGEGLMRGHHADEALAQFDAALRLAPHAPAALRHRATVLEHKGDIQAAAAAYRAILAREPLDLKTHTLLNELLHRSGDTPSFLRSYDEASAAPEPVLLTAKAEQFLKLDRPAEALEVFERALRLSSDASIHSGRARALLALQDQAGAIAAFEEGLARHPDHPDLQTAFAYGLLRAGDARRARPLVDQALTRAPLSQPALAVLGLCQRAMDDARDTDLNGFDTLIRVFDLEPPPGFADGAAFHAELERHLEGLHLGARAFFSQTLRGGTRSFDEFFRYSHALRDALKATIRQALDRYIREMADRPDHPFLGRRRRDFAFSGSWSSRMSDGGFHLNHIHDGWISAVYYVAVPDVSRDAAAMQGWLKFGEPSADIGLARPIRRLVQPLPGRLVLFPSYMWHGTVPYHSAQPRTTIAFDVMPR